MAVLPDADRVDIWARAQRDMSRAGASISLTKDRLRAAVDATDAWVDAQSTSFNNALPADARTALSAKQKAWLLMLVVARRFDIT